ncbi:GGDEF domain-containing protein [Desulfosporosinus youngiae]|uniref:GGDEF domain-containing protein n=1 Tax=Desulfosporosinus youngiae TaxID=339862 RepID=UPI0002DF8586|nr:GGDEF domain-containing protein [Desulfosporosinus youngiae]
MEPVKIRMWGAIVAHGPWGGEEFIIILPEIELKHAVNIAEKIRIIVQTHDFGIDQKISISLGVGEHKTNESFDQLMLRIDNALLKAKSDGRNRVVSC